MLVISVPAPLMRSERASRSGLSTRSRAARSASLSSSSGQRRSVRLGHHSAASAPSVSLRALLQGPRPWLPERFGIHENSAVSMAPQPGCDSAAPGEIRQPQTRGVHHPGALLTFVDEHHRRRVRTLGLRGKLASADERFRPVNRLGAHLRNGDVGVLRRLGGPATASQRKEWQSRPRAARSPRCPTQVCSRAV